MNKTLLAGLAAATLLSPLTTFAGTAGEPSQISDGHFYILGEVGYSKYNNVDNFLGFTKFDTSDVAFSLKAGYMFPTMSSWSWGIETGYFNNGQIHGNTTVNPFFADLKITQQGVDILAVLNKQVNEKVDIFGKAGLSIVSQDRDYTTNIVGTNQSVTDSKVLPKIAGGLAVNVTQNVAITGTVSHTFGDNLDNSYYSARTSDMAASSTNVLAGVRYTFG